MFWESWDVVEKTFGIIVVLLIVFSIWLISSVVSAMIEMKRGVVMCADSNGDIKGWLK